MQTPQPLTARFAARAIFGMVHLMPLPGAPLFSTMDEILAAAVEDARALTEGGVDGVVFENFGDRPFVKNRVEPETIAAMTRVITIVMSEVKVPFGVNVLRNDARAAIGIAAATGATFIRVNIHTGAMLTDQGIIEGEAADTMRRRAALAPGLLVFADHFVKHATPLAPVDEIRAARDLAYRGLADAIVIDGAETGAAVDRARLARLRQALPEVPLIIGSGLTAENAATFAAADAAIVGTSVKKEGDVAAPVDRDRVKRVVAAFKASGGR